MLGCTSESGERKGRTGGGCPNLRKPGCPFKGIATNEVRYYPIYIQSSNLSHSFTYLYRKGRKIGWMKALPIAWDIGGKY